MGSFPSIRVHLSLRTNTENTPRRLHAQEYIEIRGARENNLKNVSLRIPKRKITIFTGVSGSGKFSIVFDPFAAAWIRNGRGTGRGV